MRCGGGGIVVSSIVTTMAKLGFNVVGGLLVVGHIRDGWGRLAR
jgi:hypothetical protein